MVIAKKRAKRAVDRNHLKRILRETFRELQHEISGVDIVMIAKPGAAQATNPQLRYGLKKQWSKLRSFGAG